MAKLYQNERNKEIYRILICQCIKDYRRDLFVDLHGFKNKRIQESP